MQKSFIMYIYILVVIVKNHKLCSFSTISQVQLNMETIPRCFFFLLVTMVFDIPHGGKFDVYITFFIKIFA